MSETYEEILEKIKNERRKKIVSKLLIRQNDKQHFQKD